MNESPPIRKRVAAMKELSKEFDTYITIEPILNFDVDPFVEMIKSINPKQVNIGADSGGNKLAEPSKERLLELISKLKEFTKVKEKKNLKRLLK